MSLDFSVTYSFGLFHGPGVNKAPSDNEYQEHFLGVKAAGAWGWQPHHLHVLNVMKIWEPKPPGNLWATPGMLRDCFTSTFTEVWLQHVTLRITWCLVFVHPDSSWKEHSSSERGCDFHPQMERHLDTWYCYWVASWLITSTYTPTAHLHQWAIIENMTWKVWEYL